MTDTALGADLLERKAVQDPYPLYHELRERAVVRKHVVKTLSTRMYAWVVTGYADTRALLADPRLSKDPGRGAAVMARHAIDPATTAMAYPPSMLFTDPPDHTRLRRLLGRAFTVRRVEALRPWITDLTGRLLDGVEPGVEFDLVQRIALPVPVAVIGKLLGVPDDMYEDFRRWNDVVVSIEADLELKRATITEAYQALAGLVEVKRSRPGDDLISQLLEAEDDGTRMTDAELLSTVFLMMNAGYETTANLISSGVLALLLHPRQAERLRRDPGLLPVAVEEFLRWESPLNLSTIRFTAEEVTIGEVTIPAGEIVFFSLCAANRDPVRFPDPDTLDIGRDAGGHLAFGHGLHHCLGAPLARMEGQIVLDGLLSRFGMWRMAVPAGDLEWRDSLQLRGLRSLPVQMDFHDNEHERTTVTTTTTFDPVTAFFERCAKDDIDGAVECFAEDGVWIMPEGPEPGTSYRRDQIRDHLTGLIEARKKLEAQQMQVEFDEPLRAGDRVIVEARMLNADGKVVDRGVDVFTVRDGLIAVKDVYRKA